MIRVCCYEGKLSVDVTGRARGRGVYICRDPECLAKVIKKKALARGFRMGFDDKVLQALYDELGDVISGSACEQEKPSPKGEHALGVKR